MKIVVAPNALKKSLSAAEAARAIADGLSRALGERAGAEVVLVPVSDGGDGLVDVLAGALPAERGRTRVAGPLGAPVEAEWLFSEKTRTAVVEMAAASGIALLAPDRLDPVRASTFGTGELIREGLRAGATRVLVGLGGSATVDGGTGAARALGVRFYDETGAEVEPCGGALGLISRIDASGLEPALASGRARVEALCDAANPLLGPAGAARVYAPQKGAGPEEVELLEAGMRSLASVVERDLGLDVRDLPGAGAAGGLGAGLAAFARAKLRQGCDVVFELVGLEAKLCGADLVVTAEGELDSQSAFGKAPAEVARLAKRLGVPCVALAGTVSASADELRDLGVTRAYAIRPDGMPLVESMRRAGELLAAAAEAALQDSCG